MTNWLQPLITSVAAAVALASGGFVIATKVSDAVTSTQVANVIASIGRVEAAIKEAAQEGKEGRAELQKGFDERMTTQWQTWSRTHRDLEARVRDVERDLARLQ